MGRKKNEIEKQREAYEGDLALLGNARAYMALVYERIDATQVLDIHHVTAPALEDIKRADELIRCVQTRIGERK